ncbi:ubiquitin fusion degradation protein UFD1-domain-containing protein [Hypoxylon sp. FL0890]|nr:ubiquitin fusion degradation protein UFD1-domain-containing protein [Hypoxylon sp. FL0890]
MAEQPEIKWSATLSVTSPTTYSSKDLTGDKIILPQSALEQLLAASTSSAPSASVSNPLRNPYVSTTRAPYAFDGDPYQQLPSPLMFRLVNPSNGNTVYAGIREFSAQEGEVLLSPYLIEALGIESNKGASEEATGDEIDVSRITVHAKHLPKGTYVRLRPLEAGYNPDDWKSLLERKLRESFTTLTNGAILSVPGVKGEVFRLLIDGFRPEGDGICVVNTDLEVDIEALDEAQARETMRQIIAKQQRAPGTAGGSSVGQELNIWKAVDGQVLPGDYVDYELPSWARSRVLEIEISELQDEYGVDLFVSPKSSRQRAPPRETEHVFSVFGYTQDGSKRIVIQPTNAELENAESLLISVHGYSTDSDTSSTDASPRPFRLRVKNNTMTTDPPAASDSVATEERSPDEEQCQNCLQWVPKRTMILHENFCLRNNIVCPQCRNVFQKTSVEWKQHWHCPHDEAYGSSEMTKAKHDNIYHTERRCPSCPFTTNSILDLARHRTTLCPGKTILCQFCHLEVPQEGCGKRWCANEWCKTGRANLKLESKPSTAQLVLPQIKPLMDSVRDKQSPMYFCVDETNQRRRKLAEMLAAEGDWDLEWCIAACEAEGPDLDRARGWLINWAPSKE